VGRSPPSGASRPDAVAGGSSCFKAKGLVEALLFALLPRLRPSENPQTGRVTWGNLALDLRKVAQAFDIARFLPVT
jgi:hypothetical protein